MIGVALRLSVKMASDIISATVLPVASTPIACSSSVRNCLRFQYSEHDSANTSR